MSATTTANQVLPPPSERYSILGWLRKNLFSTWYDALLTILGLGIAYFVIKAILDWALTSAQWRVVPANLRLFLAGQYPADQLWRLWALMLVLSVITGLSWGIWVRRISWLGPLILALPILLAILPISQGSWPYLIGLAVAALLGWAAGRGRRSLLAQPTIFAWILYLPFVILVVRGFTSPAGPVPAVPTNLWGGLLLTFLLTVVGIVFSFPIGVLLALGRRSQLPVARIFSVLFIEIVRGVPLITVLFMAQLMLPLFLPEGLTVDRVLRAMVGLTLFSAAYLAENVRGGLQIIPKGQYEAAHALGLNAFQTTLRIILPQALRAVIPILVGQFIALFKDTSLVAIVGLLDLLGIAKTVLAQPQFIGRQLEVYTFIALIYWVFSYIMSYFSQRLEVSLGVGER